MGGGRGRRIELVASIRTVSNLERGFMISWEVPGWGVWLIKFLAPLCCEWVGGRHGDL